MTEPSLITTSRERQFAGGTWLLAAAPSRAQAAVEWQDQGVAWLRPGALFSVVFLRAAVVHAAVGEDSPQGCAARLAEGLDGPVFYRPGCFGPEGGYVPLLPASVGRTWDVPGATGHPGRALLEVPAPDVVEPPEGGGSWWVAPLDGPGTLCDPGAVAALAVAGGARLARERGDRGE